MNRFVPVVVLLALFLAACGVDRESEDSLTADADPASAVESSDEGVSDDAQDGADSGSGEDSANPAPTPTTLAPLPPPTTGVPTDTALSFDRGDGVTFSITHGELNEIVVPTQENEEFLNLVFGGAVPPGFTAGVSTEIMLLRVVEAELLDLGVSASDEDLEASRASLLSQVELQLYGGQPDAAALSEKLYDEAPYLPFLAQYQANQEALSAALAAEAAAEGAPEVPCVRHILVDTEAEGDDIITRLAAGEDFGELAVELSTGPSGPNGGELGCASSAGYVPEFADAVDAAEVGEFVGPVQTQFGFHVIVVDGYEPGPPADGRALAAALLEDRLSNSVVDVDENIGVWNELDLVIVPAGL